MKMIRYILIALLLLSAAYATDIEKSKKVKTPLLRDGFVLNGVDGKVSARGDKWYFELEGDVTDGKVTLSKGTRLEMLESAGLEKMLGYVSDKPDASFRLFNGLITVYEQQNYLYCDYFVSIAEADVTVENKETKDTDISKIRINEPNDTVMIPQEIIDKLSTRRIIQPQQIKQGVELKQDSILTGRTGFIKNINDKWIFVFDSLGRNKSKASLELLPCQSLARAQRKQAQEPVKIRYKVSGIVTKYKGRYYLMLQRVTPAYNYGNFGG
jgi:hypothetical protein